MIIENIILYDCDDVDEIIDDKEKDDDSYRFINSSISF